MASLPTPMPLLHPSFLSAFESATQEAKRGMLRQLISDWLRGVRNCCDHCGALLELVGAAASSAVRLHLIETEIAKELAQALCMPDIHCSAARGAATYLARHPAGVPALRDALVASLTSKSRPAAFFDGLERLAASSVEARTSICPALLSATTEALLSRQPSFAACERCMSDISILRTLCDDSPYTSALNIALATGE